MRFYGTGIDVVENAKIAESIEKFGERFLQRIFTDAELAYCGKMKFPERHYAARFAAKEAVAKAFGTGIGEKVSWQDMEICHREGGQPFVRLSGGAEAYAEEEGITDIQISLTHTDAYAAANAVILAKE